MTVRGNNPGNIRYRQEDKWQGLAVPPQIDGMCNFVSPVYGIRVIQRQLVANQDKHDCATIADHITRYAPPEENPTSQYIANVSEWTGIDPLETIDVHTYKDARPIVEAIIRQEQGKKVCTDAQIDEGLKLAGVVPEPKGAVMAVAQDPKVIGTAIGTAATGVASATGAVSGIWDSLVASGIDPRLILVCVTVLAALTLVYFIVSKISARREGRG